MLLDHATHNGESQTAAADTHVAAAIKSVEDPRDILGRDPVALIRDLDLDLAILDTTSDDDRPPSTGILDRVINEVFEGLKECHAIAANARQVGLNVNGDIELTVQQLRPQMFQNIVD